MTVMLNLKPEIEAGLMAQAQISGITVEQVPPLHGGRLRVAGIVEDAIASSEP